jgi:hypothetical protein
MFWFWELTVRAKLYKSFAFEYYYSYYLSLKLYFESTIEFNNRIELIVVIIDLDTVGTDQNKSEWQREKFQN